MIKKLTFLTLALTLLALPVFAADRYGNGVGDEQEIRMPLELERTDAMIAIVDIGTAAVADYISRLVALGYAVNPIPVDSDLETPLNYNLVILPVGHGLWVGQPNPWQHPGGTADTVLTSEYGAGKILVEFGHPSLLAICPIDDTALRQHEECTVGSNSVATGSLSLDAVKAMFK